MKVDLVFSLNQGITIGLLAAMNSIVRNTCQPEHLRFNIVVPTEELNIIQDRIVAAFPEPAFALRLREYTPPQYMLDYIQAKHQPHSLDRYKSRCMQYAKFFLGEVFPDLTKVIYLDADIVVLKDIAQLYHAVEFNASAYFAAVPHFYPAIFHFANPLDRGVIQELRQFKQTFNSGVLFTDCTYWNPATYKQLQYYLAWDEARQWTIQRGDETLFNLMFKDYLPLERQWNRCGYGNARFVGWFLKRHLNEIALLHWSGGHHKPWTSPNIAYADIWRQYAIAVGAATPHRDVAVLD